MTARVLYDLPREQYDAMGTGDPLTDVVNFSTLKLMGESPLHYKHAVESREDPDREEPDALLGGQAAHTAALEPDEYGGEDAEYPETLDPANGRPPASGRYVVFNGPRDERHKRFQGVLAFAKLGNQKILTPAMHAFAQHVGRAVRNSPPAAPYIVGGKREVTVTWEHVEPSVMELRGWSVAMRTRIDYETPAALLDLKTTKSAKPELFAKDAWRLGYFTQAAMHLDAMAAAGKPERPYLWVVVEKKAPFACSVYAPSRKGLALGRQQYTDWLARLSVCRETNHWPSYAEGVLELDPPSWAGPSDLLEAAA